MRRCFIVVVFIGLLWLVSLDYRLDEGDDLFDEAEVDGIAEEFSFAGLNHGADDQCQ
jgi:hypothetical protein